MRLHEGGDRIQVLWSSNQHGHSLQRLEFCHEFFKKFVAAVVVYVAVDKLGLFGLRPAQAECSRQQQQILRDLPDHENAKLRVFVHLV
jgi:hypothetical protein